MKLAFPAALAISILLGSPAARAVGVEGHAEVGFMTFSDQFDANGDRQDGDKTTNPELPILVGVSADLWNGLGVGIDLSMARIATDPDAGGGLDSFGMREVAIRALYSHGLGPGSIDVSLGFKLDLGKKQEDIGNDDLPTSDQQHAFEARLGYTVGVGVLAAYARVGLVAHLEREVAAGAKVQDGLLVAPALGLRAGFGPIGVGLEIGAWFQGENESNGATIKDSDSYLIYAMPWVSWSFLPGQSVLLRLGVTDEDAMIGYPIAGKNAPAPVVPPFALAYRGGF